MIGVGSLDGCDDELFGMLVDIGYNDPFEGWAMRKGANLKMVPLKYFESMNTMLNWIDEQEQL